MILRLWNAQVASKLQPRCPHPYGRCIYISFAQVGTSVETVATMTKTYYQKDTTQTSKKMSLGLCNA